MVDPNPDDPARFSRVNPLPNPGALLVPEIGSKLVFYVPGARRYQLYHVQRSTGEGRDQAWEKII
jgi:hypothetical protein